MERWLLDRFPHARWETPGDAFGVLSHRVRLPGAQVALPADHLFLDLETLGFVGRPLFLIGLLEGDGIGSARLTQILARDYAEEEAAIRDFVARAVERPVWVSFNGKSFDVPCMHLRCAFYRMEKPAPREHIDLLHRARRLFRGVFPDCRLKTLEHRVCGRLRGDDLPGSEVPYAYHRFVREGDPAWLEPILRHNRDDLVTLAELFLAITEEDLRRAREEEELEERA